MNDYNDQARFYLVLPGHLVSNPQCVVLVGGATSLL